MVDVATAKVHGVCPVCEGYGGGDDQEACEHSDSNCPGSCPKCWCPGCHDGQVQCDAEEPLGSWEAYEAVQAMAVHSDQATLDESEAGP